MAPISGENFRAAHVFLVPKRQRAEQVGAGAETDASRPAAPEARF